MRSGWLLRDGDVVCALEMADSPAERGALRGRTGCEGALHVEGARTVHTAGMKFPIDVAFLSTDLTVVRVARLKPWRVATGGGRPAAPCETEAGSLERWGVRVGDQLEVREVPNGASERRAVSDERRGRLVLVATPIGNLGDLSPRAREVLATADLICCEDTRRTRALLSASGIPAGGPAGDRLLSLHGHNEAARLDRVAAAVAGGATVAVVSDAGTPGHLGPRCAGWRRSWPPPGETVSTVPGPVVGARRAGRERAADRPLLRRGVPAPQGPRAPAPHRPRSWPTSAPRSCSRRPAASRPRWPSWRPPTRRGRSPWCAS